MPKAEAISLRARWLGERLRHERTRAGYTLKEASECLQIDFTSLGRFERGTHRIRQTYVRELISFYGISSRSTRDALLTLNSDSWRKDWWDNESHDLETEFIDYAWLEASARTIRHFELTLVPGLLQTPGYAKSIIEISKRTDDTTDVDRLVDLRMRRQQATRDANTRLRVVLDESVLRRQVGNTQIMDDQIRALISATQDPAVELRILSSTTAWHPGMTNAFTYFDMADPYPDIAYVEGIAGRTFLEAPDRVDRFRQAYDALADTAMPERTSLNFIETLIKEHQ